MSQASQTSTTVSGNVSLNNGPSTTGLLIGAAVVIGLAVFGFIWWKAFRKKTS